ncbi:MAG: hypothetical protein J5382_10435 [Bacteroidales bacterium]|nr:hypothetical protein [Bacteroidales bacterium]
MNTVNNYENALLEGYHLNAVTGWFGLSCATFTDLSQARRFLDAVSAVKGSGLDMVEPESVADKKGRVFWRVEYQPITAEAYALLQLLSRAFYE